MFEIATVSGQDPREFVTASTWLVGIGLLGSVAAGFAGFVDAMPIPPGSAGYRGLLVHMSLAMAVILLYLVEFLMRLGIPSDRPVPAALLVFALSNSAVLVVTICWGAVLARRQA